MLLLSGSGGISKKEIIDGLYGWGDCGDSANHNKNLNNLLYRLRGQLVKLGLPDEEYVEVRNRICYWCGTCKLDLDTERFEELVQQARNSHGTERIKLYKEANERYFGELLPMNAGEMWFFEKGQYFKNLYLETIQALETAYQEERNFKDLLEVYGRAATIYPFDNWQTGQLRCYLDMYCYREAEDIYNQTIELYAREMGCPPTEEMQACFEMLNTRKAKGSMGNGKTPLEWEGDISKAIVESEREEGAYYCSYPSFIDWCRLVKRMYGRCGFHAVLLFLTLEVPEKELKRNSNSLVFQMSLLKQAINQSLRKGDAYTSYRKSHYIMLLMEAEPSQCDMIVRRIEKAYLSAKGSRGTILYQPEFSQDLNDITY